MYPQQGVRFLGEKLKKTTTCIVFSNLAPIHTYGLGTIIFHKCGEMIETEEGYHIFLSNFMAINISMIHILWSFLSRILFKN